MSEKAKLSVSAIRFPELPYSALTGTEPGDLQLQKMVAENPEQFAGDAFPFFVSIEIEFSNGKKALHHAMLEGSNVEEATEFMLLNAGGMALSILSSDDMLRQAGIID